MSKNKNPLNFPTTTVDLPSKGIIYAADSEASKGVVEIMYPGAKQEDILTNGNYLQKNMAVDKYLESIVVSDIDLEDLTPGDKDAVMLYARILGFGSAYTTYAMVGRDEEIITFNLADLKEKEINWELFSPGQNEFSYSLPYGKIDVKFKLLTGKDQKAMDEEEAGIRKTSPNYSADTSLFLKYSLTEVNGARDTKTIRDFVDKKLLQIDIRELKKYIASVTPGYVWKANGVRQNKEVVEDLFVPYTVDFFWPRF